MRRYAVLPIDKLISDVPIDQLHVRELADSIMSKGQLAPIIVREETQEVIDGFHRIAAMKELGFDQVECVLTPCDDEGFWDFRIIQASLHKNVTFSRAVDWMDKVFELSTWTKRYKNALNLFDSANSGTAPKEAQDWVQAKSKTWGLSSQTIEKWLYTKQSLAEDVLEKAKLPRLNGDDMTLTHYVMTAQSLPNRPELQRRLLDKAEREQLSPNEVRKVGQALRRAGDEEEVQSILRQPISRTEEQMVREAKVERLISHPPVPEAQEIIEKVEKASNVIELKLVWEQVATIATEVDLALLGSLNEGQKEELAQSGERCIQASQKVVDYLRRKLGRLIELPRKEF